MGNKARICLLACSQFLQLMLLEHSHFVGHAPRHSAAKKFMLSRDGSSMGGGALPVQLSCVIDPLCPQQH